MPSSEEMSQAKELVRGIANSLLSENPAVEVNDLIARLEQMKEKDPSNKLLPLALNSAMLYTRDTKKPLEMFKEKFSA